MQSSSGTYAALEEIRCALASRIDSAGYCTLTTRMLAVVIKRLDVFGNGYAHPSRKGCAHGFHAENLTRATIEAAAKAGTPLSTLVWGLATKLILPALDAVRTVVSAKRMIALRIRYHCQDIEAPCDTLCIQVAVLDSTNTHTFSLAEVAYSTLRVRRAHPILTLPPLGFVGNDIVQLPWSPSIGDSMWSPVVARRRQRVA